MRAAIVNPGQEPLIRVGDWPDPVAREGWVTVRVRRASLNRNDQMNLRHPSLVRGPAVLGSDAAGVVEEVGAGVAGVGVGDEVVILPTLWWGEDEEVQADTMGILGYPTQGTHAELVTVPAENLFPKPARLTWEETAAIPMAGLTAWRALTTKGRLRAGETVVITAASSGVGTFAIQIAAAIGARVVAVTAGRTSAERARQLGAAEVVRRDEPELDQRLKAVTGGAHVTLDSAGVNWAALVDAMRPGGRMVVVGRNASPVGELPIRPVFWKHLSILGSSMGSPRDFAGFLRHLEDSTWRPRIDSTFALGDIERAYQRLDDDGRFGKVVLDLEAS